MPTVEVLAETPSILRKTLKRENKINQKTYAKFQSAQHQILISLSIWKAYTRCRVEISGFEDLKYRQWLVEITR
jgi:hypothetical protein